MESLEDERFAALEALLEENIAVTRENNRLLRELRRNALLGFIARIVIWLILLGVPLLFISSYLAPIIETMSGKVESGQIPTGVFGLPSSEQIQQLIDQYRATTAE